MSTQYKVLDTHRNAHDEEIWDVVWKDDDTILRSFSVQVAKNWFQRPKLLELAPKKNFLPPSPLRASPNINPPPQKIHPIQIRPRRRRHHPQRRPLPPPILPQILPTNRLVLGNSNQFFPIRQVSFIEILDLYAF